MLGDDAIVSLATNHPKQGDVPTFNNALCGLWAAGLGAGAGAETRRGRRSCSGATAGTAPRRRNAKPAAPVAGEGARPAAETHGRGPTTSSSSCWPSLEDRARELLAGHGEERAPAIEPVVITGAALGLPGSERLFDDTNLARLLNGEQGIDVIPGRLRRDMLDKHITRLVKAEDGGAAFETIDQLEGVIKLAARAGAFDLADEFGVDAERIHAFGRDTQLAIAAGIDALRDAGIPLVLRYKTTTTGTQLPDSWSLPDELRDDTGVIFASAFPGLATR